MSHAPETRQQARDRWLSGEMSISALSEYYGVSRGTILNWRRDGDWDAHRQRIDDERLKRSMATIVERSELNDKNHLAIWGFIVQQMYLRAKAMSEGGMKAVLAGDFMPIEDLERMAKINAISYASQGMILGTHGKNGRISPQGEEDGQRRVLIEYEPFTQTLDLGEDEDYGGGVREAEVVKQSPPPAPIAPITEPVRPRDRRRR